MMMGKMFKLTDEQANELWESLGYNLTHSTAFRKSYLERYLNDDTFDDPQDQFIFSDAVTIIVYLRDKNILPG